MAQWKKKKIVDSITITSHKVCWFNVYYSLNSYTNQSDCKI